MEIAWLFGGLATWAAAARIDMIIQQQQIDTGEFQGRLKLRSILRNTSIISLIALVIWGISSMPWYFTPISIIASMVTAGLTVSARKLPTLHLIQPLLFLASILCTAYAWIAMYPY